MTLRMTLALLLIIPAAMIYPWHSVQHRWVLGVAIAVVVILFARWRGVFVTTLIGRRWAVWRRNHAKPEPAAVERISLALRVEAGQVDAVPLAELAGYLERYGIRCESVRVISRDEDGRRDTWVSLIVDAASNLAALQARSSDLPLAQTAEVLGRRLAEQLREYGLQVSVDQSSDAPLHDDAREGWRAVRDGKGYLTSYALAADALPDSLAELRSASELWTVIEFSGAAAGPVISAACAVRTVERPATAAVTGLVSAPGLQGPLLAAMNPQSVRRLPITGTQVPAGLTWSVGAGEPVVN
jgi:type VII secretion protein EccE